MDAILASAPALAPAHACDLCGYPRTGLPADALCPECGEPPPRLADGPAASRGPEPAYTAAAVAHLRTVTAGLALLVTSAMTAIGVTLIMPIGPLTVAALNVPAPKIHAAAMIQRTIGGQPGPWGIAGTTAALTGVLAAWLITAPRSLRADEEATFSLRRLARWGCVLTAGGVLGMLLSGADPYVSPRGPVSLRLLLGAVLLCELPANALLYAYLRQLAGDVGDRRARATFDRCVWLIPVLTALAGATVVYGLLHIDEKDYAAWPTAARLALIALATAGVAVGAGASAGVMRLLATCAGLSIPAAGFSRAGVVASVASRLVRDAVAAVRADPRRWAVVAGIAVWLYAFASFASLAISYPTRYTNYGEIPMLDFLGPKVPVVSLAGSPALRYSYRMPENLLVQLCLTNLLAVWLMTWPAPGGRGDRWGGIARWTAVLLSGGMLGFGMWASGQQVRPFRHPRVVAAIIAPADLLATLPVYLHLAAIARATGRAALARSIARLGVAAPLVGLIPLGGIALSGAAHHHVSAATLVVCILQVAAALSLTFLCAGALARLMSHLATSQSPSEPMNVEPPSRPVLTVHLAAEPLGLPAAAV